MKATVAEWTYRDGETTRVFASVDAAWKWRQEIAQREWEGQKEHLPARPDDPEVAADRCFEVMEEFEESFTMSDEFEFEGAEWSGRDLLNPANCKPALKLLASIALGARGGNADNAEALDDIVSRAKAFFADRNVSAAAYVDTAND